MAVNSATYTGGVIQARCPKCGAPPMVRCMSASGVTGNAHMDRRRSADMATKGKTVHKWTADDPKHGMTIDELRTVIGEMNGLESGDARIKSGITIGGRLQWLSIEVDVRPSTVDDGVPNAGLTTAV